MHRVILDAPKGIKADHKNGNGLDNRRENLRLATDTENSRNRSIRRDSLSGLKGVHRDRNMWRARITVRGKEISLGSFSIAEKAAIAYDKAALEMFGEFAKTNFGG